MFIHRLILIIPLYYSLLHYIVFAVANGNSPALYYPVDNIAINCGSSGSSSSAVDGRQWIGDIGSKFIISSQAPKGKLIAVGQPLLSANLIPYGTARISHSQFTYTFQVNAGPKFIRLHFYPASYRGFKRSKGFFTVKAGPYTLLSNFSASLAADALGLQSFAKEFCVNVDENQPLILTFSPSPGGTSDEVYAFVNGIEIVSMPSGLYHTPEGDPGAHVVGKKYRFPIDKSIALELVQRLNVGGSSILSVEDTAGMFREWSEDSNYLLESSVLPVITTIQVKYTDIPSYSAPQKVYQTSWSMVPNNQAYKTFNFTWKLPVDLGFRYLLRFHFCELDYEIKESGHKEFSIFVNNQMAEPNGDVIKWSGGNGVTVYRDYVLTMEGDRVEGKRDLLVALHPHNHSYERTGHIDAMLKGLEVFKLSNPDNNLAGVNPVTLANSLTSSHPNPRKSVYASGGNAIATGVVIFLSILNIIAYQLRILSDKFGKKNFSSLASEGLCRHFSLDEIQSATNNFDKDLVIGSGGFGNVYIGLIDGGETIVAIKRLNSNSKQGAIEFCTEIEMLSKLRHKHLVSLIGYCDEFHEMILVYDYMEHGTLADHLYKINTNGNGGNICCLSWEQRLNICIGAARGLDYLHTGTQHGVIHRDVKTTNILLDKAWVAKISDFGLSKMGTTSHSHTHTRTHTHISTKVKGTFGYLDPQYFLTNRLTKKSDVFAFGVVLLEVLCGRAAVDGRLEEDQQSLVLWAQHCIRENKLDQIIDPSLRDQISSDCLKVFAEVASKCLLNRLNERPTMADVVVSLECALATQNQCRDTSTKEEEEVEEDDVNFDWANDEQIDENIQSDDALPQGTVPSPSTPVQYYENIPQGKKRSKGALNNVFQRTIAVLGTFRWRRTMVYDSNSVDTKSDTNDKGSILDSVDTESDTDDKGSILTGRDQSLDTSSTDSDSESLQCDSATPLYRCFSIREIRAATINFHHMHKIGESGFSKVYRSWINGGALEVAIKRLTAQASGVIPKNIQVPSQLCHLHIVSLIGYCNDEGEWILVYNYMVNGSLRDHLYGMDSGYDPLPWLKRLEICIGAARGLQYLHSVTTHEIIHGNIKSANILLDKNWVAKVSDFWLPMVQSVGITADNLDPEYKPYLRLTKKYDIYSFGVVLVEVLCARKPCNPSLNEDKNFLVRWFRTCVQSKRIDQIIDPYVVGRIAPRCLREFVRIAWNCLLDRGIERPSMDDVVGSLQIALQLQQAWHN